MLPWQLLLLAFAALPISAQQCDLGYTVADWGGCVRCPTDTYKDTVGPHACTVCSVGSSTGTSTGRTSRYNCICIAGYGGSLGNCEICPAGTYKGYGSGSCIPCDYSVPPALTSRVGATSSSKCICNVGFWGYFCSACPYNTYKDFTGTRGCIDCPPNSATQLRSVGAPNIESCKCNKGYSWNATTRVCVACVDGKYKDVVGPSECILCGTNLPLSQISPEASTSKSMCECNVGYGGSACTICTSGEYKDILGASPCISCGDAASSPIGSTNNSDCICGLGSSPEVIQGKTVCSLCDVGHYKAVPGGTECHACGIPIGERGAGGEYSEGKGGSTCTLCQPGEYINTTMATACTLCQAGTYADTNWSTGCVDCPAGYEDSAARTSCIPCTPGTFSSSDAVSSCDSCPAGTYLNASAGTACFSCAYGNMTSAEASVEPSDCFCIQGYKDRVGGGCDSDFWYPPSAAVRGSVCRLNYLVGLGLAIAVAFCKYRH